MPDVRLMLGDCLERMGEIESASVDAIICDPPYPCIDRAYGRMTEPEWHAMMRGVVAESRRVLKPSGSAVFILQPNSERVGRMRLWLWEFMVWVGREWGIVQDAYWWNTAAIPEAHAIQGRLMRPSLKACVWIGDPDCYRDQDAVLWEESERNKKDRMAVRFSIRVTPSCTRTNTTPRVFNERRIVNAAAKRNGVTPYNVMPFGNSNSSTGHGAGTPEPLMDWWVRYISPPDGVVCDPFMGSGTCGLAALKRGRSFVGVERDPGYFATAERRIAECRVAMPLFPITA